MIWAIDPGDKHCGLAFSQDGSCVIKTGELSPQLLVDELGPIMMGFDTVIIEEFALYPWASKSQAWSRLETPQLIGALKLLSHQAGARVVMQSASIKRSTSRIMKASGYRVESRSSHAIDASLHLYYWLRTNRLV